MRNAVRLASAFVVSSLAVFVACSSSSGGSGGFNTGGTFPTDDVIWVPESAPFGYEIRLNGFTGACALFEQGDTHKANATYALIDFVFPSTQTSLTTVPAGTYTIGGQASVSIEAELKTRDAQCNKTSGINATSGSVTIDVDLGAAGEAVHGTYDFALEDGSHAQGEFTASACGSSGTGAGGCAQ